MARRRIRSKSRRISPRKRKQRYSSRRRRACKTVCTVCGNKFAKGEITAAKYVQHIRKHHTAKVYC